MRLFSETSCGSAKDQAQTSLDGLTHYVEDATLRYHKSRILSVHILQSGLLLGLVESVAADPKGYRRGVRGVIFALDGAILYRPKLDELFHTTKGGRNAMLKAAQAIDGKDEALKAIGRSTRALDERLGALRGTIEEMKP